MSPVHLETPRGSVAVSRLVLDYTGTLSLDGQLIPGVAERLQELASHLEIFVLTADTFGTARSALAHLPVTVQVIGDGREKSDIVSRMGPETVVAVGNGRNDVPMMKVAALGIAVLGPEGAAAELLACAQVVVTDIRDALDLLRNPLRVKATLRD